MQTIPPLRWIARGNPFHPGEAGSNGAFPAILEQLILQRGLPEGVGLEDYLNPKLKTLMDPLLIPDMAPAVERILQAVDRKERVCIFGDYDVDGVTSVTLLRRILLAYGLESRYFIPKRGVEGYGLSEAALERCMREGPVPELLITVDCGTVSVAEVAGLRARGIDVVIVDHHEPLPGERPDCTALVNPKCGENFTYLCAAGVVFKLGHALLKTRPAEFDLRTVLDLVAVATISDIVPMIGENRLLVRHGLKMLAHTSNPGLRALQQVTGMSGEVSSMDVGFRIGPRLNAAGRMDQPDKALELLITDDPEEAMALARELDGHNRERQTHELLIRRQALEMLNGFDPTRDPVIVLGSREWHPGVVGIVASRLMRQFYKPTFVVAIDGQGKGKGSGRSIAGVSLVEAIRDCNGDLDAGGGHAMAAGISVSEEKLDQFRQHFGEYVMATTSEEQRLPRLYFDAEVGFDQLSLEFLESYELLQPFGSQNPQPVFVSRGVNLSRPPLRMKNNHLRLTLRQGLPELDAVFFGGGETQLPDPPWDVAFTVDRNTFRGRTALQLVIQDVRAAVTGPDGTARQSALP
ncbi:MAG: single-stranded-DNA-specific exonuclease RecJ [Akkermansiaceae bacterium]|nr:single-stranded-DNA-specific exonuclease RecJ [Akkermansiaceae bacterium]MCF7732093.1 single-stranded-DNA-specific exonuclease RecJ [Akkermansiaceae bacterium]